MENNLKHSVCILYSVASQRHVQYYPLLLYYIVFAYIYIHLKRQIIADRLAASSSRRCSEDGNNHIIIWKRSKKIHDEKTISCCRIQCKREKRRNAIRPPNRRNGANTVFSRCGPTEFPRRRFGKKTSTDLVRDATARHY